MTDSTMTYSAEYLAQDRRALVTAFYALPIPLEIISTLYRLTVKAGPRSDGYLGYDDYLIVWATVRSSRYPVSLWSFLSRCLLLMLRS